MKAVASKFISLLISLAWVDFALGVDLYTPNVPVAPEGEVFHCSAINVSNQARLVRIELRDHTGEVINFQESLLNPGAAMWTQIQNSGSSFFDRFCKVTVDGRKSDVRAGAILSPRGAFMPAE